MTQFKGLVFILPLALAVYWIARKKGFFHLPSKNQFAPIAFKQLLGAFGLFLLFQLLVLPLLVVLFKNSLFADQKLLWLGWAQVAALGILFFVMIWYCRRIDPKTRQGMFWGQQKVQTVSYATKRFGMGCIALAVGYPFVVLTALAVEILTLYFWGKAGMEQTVVKHLKMTLDYPFLFFLLAVEIAFFVPFIEEVLFRGFLQGWLKRHVGRGGAIPLTALIFSLAHFSFGQGVGNLELLASLFVLSLFIGFIYERERSIWAPIGLHAAFNGFSILFILITSLLN